MDHRNKMPTFTGKSDCLHMCLGFTALCETLKFNRHIHHIDFTETGITDIGLRELDETFKEVGQSPMNEFVLNAFGNPGQDTA